MEPSVPLLLATVVAVVLFSFAIGLDTRWGAIRDIFVHPKAVLVGLLGQYLLLPSIATLLILMLKPPIEVGFGMLLLASAPGGTLSNGFVYIMRGDFILSVVLTTISSIASPLSMATILVVTSAIAYGARESVSVPVVQTMLTLFVLVLIPIAVGYVVYRMFPERVLAIHKWVDPGATISLIICVTFSLYTARDALMESLSVSFAPGGLLVGLSFIAATGLAVLARLSMRQSITIAFEVGLQNIAMVIVVATQVLGRPEFAIFPLVYGSAALAVFVPLAFIIRRLNRQPAAPAT